MAALTSDRSCRFESIRVRHWPARAWVAVMPGDPESNEVLHVLHGNAVEFDAHGQWFNEAIWTGDFATGDLDEHDLAFGSGARVRGGEVVFVSSASMLDRLHRLETGGKLFVSNSFPALLAVSGARVDPLDAHGYQRFHTQRLGPGKYQRHVPTDRGNVTLTYHDHVVWQGGRASERPRPQPDLAFSRYDDYHDYLVDSLVTLARNMRDPRRTTPLSLLGTLSNGYDSTTVTVLGMAAGLKRAVSFIEPHPRSEAALAEVRKALDIEVQPVSRYAFRSHAFPEVPFLSSGSYGYEMQFMGIEAELAGTVLLTGYYGDRIWGIDLTPMQPMARTSQSGISLTEYRLHANFVHLPVPFLGARALADVRAISTSAEMRPWLLGNGYDRPIPRRIVESAGVPRGSFAFEKLMSSVSPRGHSGFSDASQQDYLRFLRENGGGTFIARARSIDAARRSIGGVGRSLVALDKRLGSPNEHAKRFFKRVSAYGREPYLFKFSYGWAVERAVEAYELALARSAVKLEPSDGASGGASHQSTTAPSGSAAAGAVTAS